jgi:hypothetical protein
MIANQIALIRRELWEHRSIFVTPAAIGLILSLGVLVTEGMLAAHTAEVDIGIAAASNLGEMAHRSAVINGLLFVPSVIIFIGMSILVVFFESINRGAHHSGGFLCGNCCNAIDINDSDERLGHDRRWQRDTPDMGPGVPGEPVGSYLRGHVVAVALACALPWVVPVRVGIRKTHAPATRGIADHNVADARKLDFRDETVL